MFNFRILYFHDAYLALFRCLYPEYPRMNNAKLTGQFRRWVFYLAMQCSSFWGISKSALLIIYYSLHPPMKWRSKTWTEHFRKICSIHLSNSLIPSTENSLVTAIRWKIEKVSYSNSAHQKSSQMWDTGKKGSILISNFTEYLRSRDRRSFLQLENKTGKISKSSITIINFNAT